MLHALFPFFVDAESEADYRRVFRDWQAGAEHSVGVHNINTLLSCFFYFFAFFPFVVLCGERKSGAPRITGGKPQNHPKSNNE